MDYKDCKFGIEMEYSGCSRKASGEALASMWGTRCSYAGGSYREYHVNDPQGRTWKIMRDSSVRPTDYGSNASDDYKCELVSPVLGHGDMSMLMEVIRAIRGAGGRSNKSCGFHVHLSCPEEFNVKQLTNLVNMVHSKQDLIYEALSVYIERQNFCRKIPIKLCETIKAKRPRTLEQMADIYYEVLGGNYGRYDHYCNARYYALNCHNLFSGRLPTVEFRCAIGAIGDELAICRKFMLEKLDGNIAWRDRA